MSSSGGWTSYNWNVLNSLAADGGQVAIWEMNGTQIQSAGYTMEGSTTVGVPAGWTILWQTANGSPAIWEMNGFQTTDAAYITQGSQQVGAPGADWHLNTTGDFYGNGKDDLLWETMPARSRSGK